MADIEQIDAIQGAGEALYLGFAKANQVITKINTIEEGATLNLLVLGTIVLPAGDKQVLVTHGYSGTPTFALAIPSQNIGNVWITSIGATTFTINTSASTDTDTTFYWLAGG